ncbi:uncharacterized protein LOC128235109 [Mya arenaria]|uniref:uncharacterized protein LOC128235109 n=1 Tax=Mya arenaria TaxID=6604 RepID=UPI0022DFAF2F|nr:uncharacterized protein LOC128235109 [Mya arenaria]
MGQDHLSLMSFNSSRRGLCSLPTSQRSPYLEKIIVASAPDICLLPGDEKAVSMNAVKGYGQYKVQSNDGLVMLYNNTRVRINSPHVSLNSFGPLPGLDMDSMVCPGVEVLSLTPSGNKSVIKEFSMVTWKYTMVTEAKVQIETLAESLILFSQCLAWSTGKPVLVGGELTIDHGSLKQIVGKLCKEGQETFLSGVQPEMGKLGYLPSMTKGSLRDQRHLFMMNVYKCSSGTNGFVQARNEALVADCFIASKALELTQAKLVDVEQVTGRQIKLEMLRKHCPTETSVHIPQRPPRHNGG